MANDYIEKRDKITGSRNQEVCFLQALVFTQNTAKILVNIPGLTISDFLVPEIVPFQNVGDIFRIMLLNVRIHFLFIYQHSSNYTHDPKRLAPRKIYR